LLEEQSIAVAVSSERFQTLVQIRRALKSSPKPLRQIARESGVSRGTVCAIANGSVVKVSTAQRLAAHLEGRNAAA
jgi:transcriptional regulator with XRE-family HTH domain